MKKSTVVIGLSLSLLSACSSSSDSILEDALLNNIQNVTISESQALNDYAPLKTIKKLTNEKDVDSFKQMLKKAHRVQHTMDKTDYDVLVRFHSDDEKNQNRIVQVYKNEQNSYYMRLVGKNTETFEVDVKDATVLGK